MTDPVLARLKAEKELARINRAARAAKPQQPLRTSFRGDCRTGKGRHRNNDHATSVLGARDVAFRAGSQLHRLLDAYHMVDAGLTDEEAGVHANLLESCYWKRCGELRQDGFIEIQRYLDGSPKTRLGSAGTPRFVCSITGDGVAYLARLA